MALTTQSEIDGLARRIRHAYHARGKHWHAGCSTTRVWTAAALVLTQLHHDHPEIPMDPELFVAAQALDGKVHDVWEELASEAAGRAYHDRVWRIVRRLERELRREIDRTERLIHRGRPIEEVLGRRDARISALGRFIVACRAGRRDLADGCELDALVQHRSCPLYRPASLVFLRAEDYPDDDAQAEISRKSASVARTLAVSLN